MSQRYTCSLLFAALTSAAIQFDGHNGICSTNSVQIVRNESQIWPSQQYQSSNATPPYLSINRTGEPLAPGLIFLAQSYVLPDMIGVKVQQGFIMSDANELIWAGPLGDVEDMNVQQFDNKPVITYWEQTSNSPSIIASGHGYGATVLLDTSYHQVARVCPQLNLTLPPGRTADCEADIHEIYITPHNSVVITAYNITTADLTGIGGPQLGWVYDPLVLEIDIVSGDVLFKWSPLSAQIPINKTHEPLGASGRSPSDAFDYFHLNSIQWFEGQYLVNSRNLWTTYLINSKGNIVWEINGVNGGDFGTLPENGTFSWEHYGRIERTSPTHATLSYMANNAGFPNETSHPSVGLALNISLRPDRSAPPTLLTQLIDPHNLKSSPGEGTYLALSNGNYFLDYGLQPFMMEYGPLDPHDDTVGGYIKDSRVRWSAQFAPVGGGHSYRAYKREWHATPSTPPSLTVLPTPQNDSLMACLEGKRVRDSGKRGFVSWNGATDVSAYVLFVGHGEVDTSLQYVGGFAKKGFETEFAVPEGARFVQIGAVQAPDGGMVRRSNVVAL